MFSEITQKLCYRRRFSGSAVAAEPFGVAAGPRTGRVYLELGCKTATLADNGLRFERTKPSAPDVAAQELV